MKKIHINVSKSYDVLIEHGLLRNISLLIDDICLSKNVSIITDDIVNRKYGCVLEDNLISNGYNVSKFVFPNGESSKNIGTLSNILEFLAEKELKRNDTLVALGGGVVGDITGLAAATYMRGIKFIQIPTTLISMVDASIGGKTAIDLKAGKNLAGAFWQPSLVICDLDIIHDLPVDIFREGMAEVIKSDIIDNIGVCDCVIEGTLKEKLDEIIYRCISMKEKVVEQDEFETKGVRQVLNEGHTIAHGIEKMSNYSISHGRAVGTGLVYEAAISKELGYLKEKDFAKIKESICEINLFNKISFPFDDFVKAMKKDKKNDDDLISFILPCSFGAWRPIKINIDELTNLLIKVEEYI